MQHPKISIVTPSYNQGQFIEETIISVLGQNYPNLEYIIMDGGSNDNTIEILKKYEHQITYWQSEPDNGQSSAINEGFKRATGDILCWLNSDDYYLPGTLQFIANNINITNEEILFGNCIHLKENSSFCNGSNVVSRWGNEDLKVIDMIIQPSSFFSRKAVEKTGGMREDLNFGFDWEWFLRAEKKGVSFKPLERYLSVYRYHEEHKSGGGFAEKRAKELAIIYKEYTNEEIAGFYLFVFYNKEKIRQTVYKLAKFRLSRFNILLMPLFYPKIKKYGWKITSQYLAMT